MAAIAKAQDVAKAVGIAPRTKRFEAIGADGLPVFMIGEAERWEHVISAIRLARTERGELDVRTYTIACAIWKWINTGRANPTAAMKVRARSPYQVCALVARISGLFEGEPTVGELADFWINKHAEEL
jgi:hypothetical protein